MKFTTELKQRPIQETWLREWLKKVHQIVPVSRHSPKDWTTGSVELLIEGLLETAYTPGISARHRAASCNFICAIFDISRQKQDDFLEQALRQANAWQRLFNVFVERSDVSMAKSMRQVLITLTSDLKLQLSFSDGAGQIRDESVCCLLGHLFETQDHLRAKPAIQALTYFMAKEVVDIRQLVSLFNTSHLHLYPGAATSRSADASILEDLLQRFYTGVFAWVEHNDVSLAAGQLVVEITRHGLKTHNSTPIGGHAHPIWAAPALEAIRLKPDSLSNFKHQVFPSLFRSSIANYYSFLQSLNIQSELATGGGAAFDIHSSTIIDTEVLFTALQIGKAIGLVRESESISQAIVTNDSILIPVSSIGRLLNSRSPNIRLSAASLAISGPVTTQPFSRSILRCLQRSFPSLVADADAEFRGELLGLFGRLLNRLRGACSMLFKAARRQQLRNPDTLNPTGAELDIHESFTRWLLRFLLSELHPNAPYQSHICALQMLLLLLRSGIDGSVDQSFLLKYAQSDIKWPFSISVFDGWTARVLQDLLMNPFDDVRQAAAAALLMAPPKLIKDNRVVKIHVLPSFSLERAGDLMLHTGRADHADGVARAYSILFAHQSVPSLASPAFATPVKLVDYFVSWLEKGIEHARADIAKAVQSSPLHGQLIALRYFIEQPTFYQSTRELDFEALGIFKQIHRRMCAVLHSIWDCVKHVLCNDAPEGYVLDDAEELPDITTKDVLSYCWRALKESSALQKSIISNAPICAAQIQVSTTPQAVDEDAVFFLPADEFESLGNLCFAQLSELRHRGAFSTVAQTFASCCTRALALAETSTGDLNRRWYDRAVLSIEDKASTLTRRSAGLPALLVGILSANADRPLFLEAISTLFSISSSEVTSLPRESVHLPQAHAMNCLKAIYTNSKLGAASEPHVLAGVELAASSLHSKYWAIRNCGLMLLRALLDRMLGTHDSANVDVSQDPAVRFSYSKYPTLLNLMFKLLRAEIESESKSDRETPAGALEGVFPVLHLLQRAPPGRSLRETFIEPVIKLTKSPHWHVRDMAARSLVRIVDKLACEQMWSLFPTDSLMPSQNSLHGFLLFVHHSVRRIIRISNCDESAFHELAAIHQKLLNRFDMFFTENSCPTTKATYVDILSSTAYAAMTDADIAFYGPSLQSPAIGDYSALIPSAVFLNQPPMLRATLATNMTLLALLEPRENERSNVVNVLLQLVMNDAGICSKVLLDVLHCLIHKCRVPPDGHEVARYASWLCELTAVVRDVDILSSTYECLGEILRGNFSSLDIPVVSPHAVLHPETPPSLADAMLRIWGFSISKLAMKAHTEVFELRQMVSYLVESANSYLQDSRTFSSRLAAIQGLRGLFAEIGSDTPSKIARLIDTNNDWFDADLSLGIILSAYDALNDDDDEIRDVASEVAAKALHLLNSKSRSRLLTPTSARQSIALNISKTYPTSRKLCIEGTKRMVQPAFANTSSPIPASSIIIKGFERDNTLFVIEKQNLYIDEVREAVLWAQVLKRLSARAIPGSLAAALSVWVIEGLDELISRARTHNDGPLGWTWKPEVFTAGWQVVCAADVLLHWRARTRKVIVSGNEIRKKMAELAEAGGEGGSHCLNQMWLDKINLVLRRAVVGRLVALRGKLEGIEERIRFCQQ